jgi:hypothetical protein
VTVIVAISPALASTILGALRLSIIPFGRCHKIATILGPVNFSISAAIRGPMPFNFVTGEKIGNKISGRILKIFLKNHG